LWHDTGLVFTTTIGTMLDQHNIRRGFRQITRAAGLGDEWVPRELRHIFVSIVLLAGAVRSWDCYPAQVMSRMTTTPAPSFIK